MSLEKYSVVFENEAQRRDRSGRRWAGWTGLDTARGRRGLRGARLSRAEKAGLLGMVAVVVIILSVAVTSGGRSDLVLSPDSDAEKTRAALAVGGGFENMVRAQRPDQPGGSNPGNKLFGGPGEDGSITPLNLGDPSEEPRVQPAKPEPKPKLRPYEIRKGDTLGHIARRMLGKSSRWREIKQLNPTINENNLQLGTTIKIPAR